MTSPSAPPVGHLPPPDQLRQEAKIQGEVQVRLKQLVDNAKPGKDKIKSQRAGSVEVFVNNNGRMNMCSLVRLRLEVHTTNLLLYHECLVLAEPSCKNLKTEESMLEYVINLLNDATDFSWASAMASHVVFLSHMERGEIQSWSQTDNIGCAAR